MLNLLQVINIPSRICNLRIPLARNYLLRDGQIACFREAVFPDYPGAGNGSQV